MVPVHEGTVYLYTGHDLPPPGIDDYHMEEDGSLRRVVMTTEGFSRAV